METPEQQAARTVEMKACLERHDIFEADPTAFGRFCADVSAGETPLAVCNRLGLNLYHMNMWIRKDDQRRVMLDEALVSRSEAIKWMLENQLHAIASFDVRVLFGENHQLLPVDQWPDEVGMAVAGVDLQDLFEMVESASGHGKDRVLIGYLKKIKVWDKLGAIDKLGKQHGQFRDKAQERIADSLESLLAKSFTPPK